MDEKGSVIDRCIRKYGSISAFARVMNVDRSVAWNWKAKGYIPAKYAFEVETLTKGEVKAKEVISDSMGKINRPKAVEKSEG